MAEGQDGQQPNEAEETSDSELMSEEVTKEIITALPPKTKKRVQKTLFPVKKKRPTPPPHPKNKFDPLDTWAKFLDDLVDDDPDVTGQKPIGPPPVFPPSAGERIRGGFRRVGKAFRDGLDRVRRFFRRGR